MFNIIREAFMKEYKKILSLFITTVMLLSLVVMAVPVSAAVETPITLVPNEDNYVNGVRIRFETTGTDTYAKIDGGKLNLKMKEGDLLWFPDLNVKDTTTSISYEIASNSGNAITFIVSGIGAKDSGTMMYAQAFGNYQGWICARLKWNDAGTLTYSSYDTWYKLDGGADSYIFPTGSNPIFNQGESMTATTTFVAGETAIRPVTTFKESNVEAEYYHTYGEMSDVVPTGSFGIAARDSQEISIDSITATNINGNNGSYTEDFETISDYNGPIINMSTAGTTVEFDSGIAFIEFKFQVHKDVTADTEFVVRKNGEVVGRQVLSTFTPEETVYTYSTHFTPSEYTDVLSVCLEKNGDVLPESTHEIDYGAQYKDFVENPPSVSSADLINVTYSETFDEAIVLQPGENIVNGKKWTYVKNSTDGSAVIKDGKLYFTGSKNDMIIFDDLDVDQISYRFEYEITYLETPVDDNWENWDCWFGGLVHLADSDTSGNRFGYVTSITPNDVYMLQGVFGTDGAFTPTENKIDHAYFPNIPGNTTQPGELYYFNGRLGNGIPTRVATFVGVSNKAYGGIGMNGYAPDGSDRVSANLPGYAGGVPSMDKRVGKLGFVCSDSEVTVIVDNLKVLTRGKNVTVDGEAIQVPADGEIKVSNLQSSDKKLVYATVDGTFKYLGDTFTATRLTQINTVQVALSTRKVVADGQTGLKWMTEIVKADYEKLLSDPNISKVEVGTVVVPTANAKDGITLDKATSNIVGTAIANGDTYAFDGILNIDKEARDISYSGIGYIKVTMTDGKVTTVYSDYAARNHAYALSDLVEEFIDDEPTTDDNGDNDASDSGTTPSTDANDDASEEKKGCGSSIVGFGIVIIVALTATCFVTKKAKENNTERRQNNERV